MPEDLYKKEFLNSGVILIFYFITFRLVIKNSEIWPQKRRSTISVHQFKCLVHFFKEKNPIFHGAYEITPSAETLLGKCLLIFSIS